MVIQGIPPQVTAWHDRTVLTNARQCKSAAVDYNAAKADVGSYSDLWDGRVDADYQARGMHSAWKLNK